MKTLVVANWKENKTIAEAEQWTDGLNKELRIKNEGSVEIIVCPPSILIPILHSLFIIPNSPLRLGAQDVSKFEEGQYTGEVSAKMLKGFVDYVIVGHSERRKYFGETDDDVKLKVEQCLKHNLIPIVCVSHLKQVSKCHSIKVSQMIFAYEPLFAVGSGKADTPENANEFAKKIKAEVGQDVRVLYGGSVTAENVKSFVEQPDINGVLVGEASLEAEEFAGIVKTIKQKNIRPAA